MDLLTKIAEAGVEPLFDMRGQNRTETEFWKDFYALGTDDMVLLNVHAISTRRIDPVVDTGNRYLIFPRVLEECLSEDIVPVLQPHPVSGTNFRSERNQEFLYNMLAMIESSGLDEYVLMVNDREHLPVIEEVWRAPLEAGIARTGFRYAHNYVNSVFNTQSFNPSDFDTDLFAVQLPNKPETREQEWKNTLKAMELAHQKMNRPVRTVMVDPRWPDVRMDL